MKILFITNKVPWPLKDGGAIGVFNLAYGLALTGCEVDMLSMNTIKHKVNTQDIPTEVTNKINIQKVNADTKVKTLPLIKNFLFSKKPYIAERFYNQDFKNTLINKLNNNKYDAIILEMIYLGYYIPVIRRYSNAHITMRAPNIEHEIWEHISKNAGKIKRFYLKNMAARIKKMELDLLNSYDSLAPVSRKNESTLKKLGLTVPSIYTTTGVFLDKTEKHRKKSNIEFDQKSIAHIGALDWMPNIEGVEWFLNNVWEKIHKADPEIKFYIAGRNAPENAKERFNHPNVIFMGEVPDAYVFMLSKAVMIVPLLSGSGMRVKIIEGLALGKAMVSTSTGAEGIDVENNKHIEIADKAVDFANACLKLIEDQAYRKNLSENGRKFVKESYDNIKIAENLKSFYKQQIK